MEKNPQALNANDTELTKYECLMSTNIEKTAAIPTEKILSLSLSLSDLNRQTLKFN